MKLAVIAWAWLMGLYAGYTLRPAKVIERHIKVICVPDNDTDAKAGDSVEFKVSDWIEFKRKTQTEEI